MRTPITTQLNLPDGFSPGNEPFGLAPPRARGGILPLLGLRLRETLEAASVAGLELPGQALVAALDVPAGEVQEACRALGMHRLLQASGESDWPGGTHAPRYAFTQSFVDDPTMEAAIEAIALSHNHNGAPA